MFQYYLTVCYLAEDVDNFQMNRTAFPRTLLPSVFSPRRRCHFTFHQWKSLAIDNLQCVISSRLISVALNRVPFNNTHEAPLQREPESFESPNLSVGEIKRELITHCRLSMARDSVCVPSVEPEKAAFDGGERAREDRKGATLSVGWADGIDNVNWLSQPEIAPTLLALKHIKRRTPSLDFSWGHDANMSTIYYPNLHNEIFISFKLKFHMFIISLKDSASGVHTHTHVGLWMHRSRQPILVWLPVPEMRPRASATYFEL